LTQKEVAEKAGVSLITLRAFENGKAVNITMGNLLALLRVIEQLEGITEILPEIPISPYQLLKLQSKQKKRIRHGK
jgi:transcriptional regulator with XRE-family HTH domain